MFSPFSMAIGDRKPIGLGRAWCLGRDVLLSRRMGRRLGRGLGNSVCLHWRKC